MPIKENRVTYEFEGKTEKEAVENACAELGLEQDEFDVEILEVQKNSIFKKGFVRIRVYTDENVANPEETLSRVKNEGHNLKQGAFNAEKEIFEDPEARNNFESQMIDFLSSLITKMGYEISVEILSREERKLILRLISPNFSILIGRRGKNLDALQLIANAYASKLGAGNARVVLDCENYRLKREETLVRLAYNTADRVRTTRNSILLGPMNPFERRLIHTSLNDIADIETKSEGDGLYKQVRVLYKTR